MTKKDTSAAFDDLPHNQAAENNKEPIFQAWSQLGLKRQRVFEIGSGTGQQGVFLCAKLPELQWTPSEVSANLEVLNLWFEAAKQSDIDNFQPPVLFDIQTGRFPQEAVDVIYTSNVLHIVSNELAKQLVQKVSDYLAVGNQFVCYGPYKVDGDFTTESSREFDFWLKSQGYGGLFDVSKIEELSCNSLSLLHKVSMPANNFLLVFEKTST